MKIKSMKFCNGSTFCSDRLSSNFVHVTYTFQELKCSVKRFAVLQKLLFLNKIDLTTVIPESR